MTDLKEIIVEDIPAEGLDISASEADPWFRGIVKDALGDAFGEGDSAGLSLHIDRLEGNVNVQGAVTFSAHPACDRCLARYEYVEELPLHTVLAPLYESRRQQEMENAEEVELVKEDLEFQYYEGDRFDLAEVVREHIVLNEPMKHLCSDECKGICQRCGKDLNEGQCGCPEERNSGSFAVLKDFRPNSDTKH